MIAKASRIGCQTRCLPQHGGQSDQAGYYAAPRLRHETALLNIEAVPARRQRGEVLRQEDFIDNVMQSA